jgi:ribulose-5-phosphate 4-epimerase/fuculose-1-phosphate aldolase
MKLARVGRRQCLVSGLTLGAGFAATRRLAAQTSPVSAGAPNPALIEDLAAANRILVDQGVLDGYGHVSAQHDRGSNRDMMSRSIAPELVNGADIMEYDLDSDPVDARGRVSYLDHFIHGEIYKARPDVKAVLHSHSQHRKPLQELQRLEWAARSVIRRPPQLGHHPRPLHENGTRCSRPQPSH